MFLIYILIMAVTFYIGGIYRNLPVTVLFLAEAVILVFLIVQSLLSRRKVKCFFEKNVAFSIKNIPSKRKVIFENNSHFTLSKLSCRIKSFYNEDEKTKEKKYTLFMPSHSENSIEISAEGKYCGILTTRVSNVKISDFLGITNVKTKAAAEGSIAVLPSEKPLKIIKKSGSPDYEKDITESALLKGSDSQEVHQLRPYRYGDPVKNIHKNMSAKTDEIYYKEFRDTESSNADLFIDLRGLDEKDTEKSDVFYELCSSVILGIFDCLGSVDVHWFNGSRTEKMTLRERNALRNILVRLYMCKSEKTEDSTQLQRNENCFVFNTSLELFADKKLIYTFSDEIWEEQIQTEEFII